MRMMSTPGDPVLEATLLESRKLQRVKVMIHDYLGRIDFIEVGKRRSGVGDGYTIDSREWIEGFDDDVDFEEYRTARSTFRPGMVLDLYCYAHEIYGKPEYGGSLVGNVELRIQEG